MLRPSLISACLAALSLLAVLPAQTLFLDGIGVGPAVTVTGGGGPPSSSVELFKNGVSAGSTATTAGGQFSFANVTTALNDSFEVAVGQVWNFNTNGNAESWVGNPGDTTLVSGGTLKFTETANGNDMGFTLFGDNLIKTKARALEVRMRFQGSGTHASSITMRTAGPNGVQNGGTGDDTISTISSTVDIQNSAEFQTYVFDLGTYGNGLATNWQDSYLPIALSLFVPGTNTGNTLEVDSIRLTESMRWEFNGNGDFAEWVAGANTSLSNTGGGVLRTTATAANSNLFIARPFRVIGSTHFTQLETRLRQVTSPSQSNLVQWNYLSNPAGYNGGGFQVAGLTSNGTYQTVNVNLTGTSTYGNNWGTGGGATLNVAGNNAFQTMFASAAGQYAEIDYIRLHPAVRYGPSAAVTASGTPAPPSYYISFSGGNDSNTGRSKSSPWKTFNNMSGLTLAPGSTVYLKRGDTWANSKLTLAGKGAPGNPIALTAYGEGKRPRITGINLTTEPCIVWNNPSYVNIDSMDCRDAKIGIYLRFTGGNADGTGDMFNNSNVHITNCYFRNMDEVWSNPDGSITVQPPYELAWGAGVWLGGSIPGISTSQSQVSVILDDFSVTHCGFDQVNTGVGCNFYNSVIHRDRFRNFRFEDSWVTGCENGSFALTFVNGGHARRVDTWIGGTGFYATGTTAGFIQHMQNYTIDDCQFAFNQRNSTGNDGTGFDYEGNTANMTFTNNVSHDNDGAGMMMLGALGNHANFNLSNNTFWNNCRDPKTSSQNYELRSNSGDTGTFTNNGVYKGAAGVGVGAPGVYDNSTRWTSYTGGSNNRILNAYSTVSTRPLAWPFTSSLEGWTNVNQWGTFAAAGGAMTGTSLGEDPFVESPATWANTRERRWVLVRMSQTAGTAGQIFFQTETSPGFAEAKSVAFPIIADGVMRDYVVDLGQCANYKGVVTIWRLDPTNAGGSTMVIDRFDSMLNPYLATVTPVASNIIDVRFNQAMHPDGGVFSTATYSLSGLGQGTATSQPTSVSLISTATGPVYRLIWSGGHTNGLGAVLTASGATDARGNPLWSGSQLAMTTVAKTEVDTDGDGMPDAWETTAGLLPNNPADAALDKDGDGQSNLKEYLADTNPASAASRFHVTNIAPSPANPAFLRVTWASQPGMAYYVDTSDSLGSNTWILMNPNPIIANSAQSFWDAATFGPRRFYRVRSFRPNPLVTP